MAVHSLTASEIKSMSFQQCLDHFAPQIMLKGFGRPWQVYAAHGAVFAANYGGFLALVRRDLMKLLFGEGDRPADKGESGQAETANERKAKLAALVYAKFLVWQHLAEAIGCRQGPLMGHTGIPNNWKYRLSLGTIKCPLLPFLGKKRNIFDLVAHVLFFASGIAFLRAKEYKLKYIRTLCACDVWICLSDLTQFFASTGHAYFSMLLSACFAPNNGQLAGMQTALIMQWFFSGVGKIGPWFSYVNGPFMLQSKWLAGSRWLFDLLVKSTTDLSPTLLGMVVAHTAAAVEYIAPLALMIPKKVRREGLADAEEKAGAKTDTSEVQTLDISTPQESGVSKADLSINSISNRLARASVWLGLIGITGMHGYILTMPAPFDVYSWNASFGLSAIYLFFYANFGFDHRGAKKMHPGLAAWLLGEFALCWYGQFYPDKIGYYISHRYWAGNWVQTFFFAKPTKAVMDKLKSVKTFNSDPQIWSSIVQGSAQNMFYSNMAYLWLANLNMKAFVGMVIEGVRAAGGAGAAVTDYMPIPLAQLCCGEFRDNLYTTSILPTMQEELGFDSGECFMMRLGAFGMLRQTATWGIYDMKDGWLKSGAVSLSKLAQMNSLPSQSIEHVRELVQNA